MRDSQKVAEQLPFLRRYARALTGSQASGDAYVAATLEALIADRAVLDDSAGPRVALYRLFTKIWNSVPVNGAGEPSEQLVAPDERKLAAIMPLPRQAFLLIALEEFDEADDLHGRANGRGDLASAPATRTSKGVPFGSDRGPVHARLRRAHPHDQESRSDGGDA